MIKDARQARDGWIARRCQCGEPGAFEALVREMERPLFYFVLKLLGSEDAARDVLQDVWIKAFRGISALRVPEALRAWLYRVARGTALNRLRGDAARSDVEEPLEDSGEGPHDAGTETSGFGPDDVIEVDRALDRLTRRHREVLVLLFVDGLTVDEIAAVVGAPPGTVKSRIYHGKRALRRLLEGYGHE